MTCLVPGRRSFVERDARGIVGLSEKEALRSSSPASLLSPATNGDEADEADGRRWGSDMTKSRLG